jgi:hypothetical protein
MGGAYGGSESGVTFERKAVSSFASVAPSYQLGGKRRLTVAGVPAAGVRWFTDSVMVSSKVGL